MTTSFVPELLRANRVVVCVGAGGVGKTTATAALGFAAARTGRDVLVLTIDPANRLADALGLPQLSGTPVPVPLDVPGRLTAMRLDARATFDGLIRRLAPSATVAEVILGNRLYSNIAGSLAASESYMAVERLYELVHEEPSDLIILDTPPTQHALDFLEAPARILEVLNSRVLGILQNPAMILTSTGSRLSQLLLGTVLRVLEDFTGLTLLRDVAEFVRAFDGMVDALRERAASVERLLRASTTTFVLIAAPSTLAIGRTEMFYRTLRRVGVPCAGLIVNRVLPRPLFDRPPLPPDPDIPAGLPPVLADKLAQSFADLHALATAEYDVINRLRTQLHLGDRLAEVPAFPADLASLDDVVRFADALLDGHAAPHDR